MPQQTGPAEATPTRKGSTDPTASHLMLQIKRGDPRALEQLMGRYWNNLEGYASRLLGCADEGKDVAQEVFVRIWEHRVLWKPGGSPESFLYRIACNLSLLQLRRRRVRSRSGPEIQIRSPRAPTPFDHTSSGELRRALQEAVGKLPTRRRQAFQMVRIEEESLGAAAERMGLSKQTVANHVCRATADLERTLGPYLS